MNSGNKLSKDYFDLIRDALKEENKKVPGPVEGPKQKRPLKKRKTDHTIDTGMRINENSALKNDTKKGIDYKALVDLTENDVGEADFSKPDRKRPSKNVKRKTPFEVISLDSSSDEGGNEYVISSDASGFLDDSGASDAFSNGDEYDEGDFEDVDIQGDSNHVCDAAEGNFTFTVNDTRGSGKNKKRMISSELKQKRLTYYLFYIMFHLFVVSQKNLWCNNKRLQTVLDPLLPSRIFNSLHPPKDIKLPVKSTNKLIHGLKDAIVFWSSYFTVDEKLDIGNYMRKWNELTTLPLHKAKNILTEKGFVDMILNTRRGSKEVSLLGFVAILRSVGLNCRLVYNMQPPDISDIGRLPKKELSRYDYEDLKECESFKFPIFWCEVWDKYTKKWLSCDPVFFKTVERHVSNAKSLSKLCPRISKEEQRLVTRFVVAFNKTSQARDVTPRYTNRYFNKVFMKRFRNNKKLDDWYISYLDLLGNKTGSTKTNKGSKIKIDEYEDKFMEEKLSIESFPESLKDFQNHPKFVLESKIAKTRFYLSPDVKPIGFFKKDKVFLRDNLQPLKTKNKWLQEGRVVKEKVLPKVLAKSFNNHDPEKKEKELFIFEQTESFVPHAPLANGRIITNKFGNIEIYHPSMIPINCVLLDHPLVVEAADFLKIQYAKAVTGWDYKNAKTSRKVSRSQKVNGKGNNNVTAKFGGIVCLRDFKDAVIAIVEEMERINYEKKKSEKQKTVMREWVNLFKRLKIKERLSSELNESGWLETDDMKQREVNVEEESIVDDSEIKENEDLVDTRKADGYDAAFSEEEAGGFEVDPSGEDAGGFEVDSSGKDAGGFEVDSSDEEADSFSTRTHKDETRKSNSSPADMNFEDFMNEIDS